jgi:hypothetical protein
LSPEQPAAKVLAAAALAALDILKNTFQVLPPRTALLLVLEAAQAAPLAAQPQLTPLALLVVLASQVIPDLLGAQLRAEPSMRMVEPAELAMGLVALAAAALGEVEQVTGLMVAMLPAATRAAAAVVVRAAQALLAPGLLAALVARQPPPQTPPQPRSTHIGHQQAAEITLTPVPLVLTVSVETERLAL